MASYYYLISSLPDLRTDGEMPFSYEEFLGMCQSNVSESKYECLKNLTLSSEEGPIMSYQSTCLLGLNPFLVVKVASVCLFPPTFLLPALLLC